MVDLISHIHVQYINEVIKASNVNAILHADDTNVPISGKNIGIYKNLANDEL